MMHAAALARDFARRRGARRDAHAGRVRFACLSANAHAGGSHLRMAAYGGAVSLVYLLAHRPGAPQRISQVFATHTHYLQVLLRLVQQTVVRVARNSSPPGNAEDGRWRQWQAATSGLVRNPATPSRGAWPAEVSSTGRPGWPALTLLRLGGRPTEILSLLRLRPDGYLPASRPHARTHARRSGWSGWSGGGGGGGWSSSWWFGKPEQADRSPSSSHATASLALETIGRIFAAAQHVSVLGLHAHGRRAAGTPPAAHGATPEPARLAAPLMHVIARPGRIRSIRLSEAAVPATRAHALQARSKPVARARRGEPEAPAAWGLLTREPLRNGANLFVDRPSAGPGPGLPGAPTGLLRYRSHHSPAARAGASTEATHVKTPAPTVRTTGATRIDSMRPAPNGIGLHLTAESVARSTRRVEINRFSHRAFRLAAAYPAAPLERNSADTGHAIAPLQRDIPGTAQMLSGHAHGVSTNARGVSANADVVLVAAHGVPASAHAPGPLAHHRPAASQTVSALLRYDPARAPHTGFAWRQSPGSPAGIIQREIRRIESSVQTQVVREILRDSHHQQQIRTAVSEALLAPHLVQSLARRIQALLEQRASIERYRKETR